jgi:RNA polymerase sigma-70 factor (ECF subfamily)
MNDHERELIKSAQNGCVAAYEELIKPHQSRVYSFLLSECGNEFEACQLTQEVFVKVFESLVSKRGSGSLACDIYRCANEISQQIGCISKEKVLIANL